jgi:hypothetical protein
MTRGNFAHGGFRRGLSKILTVRPMDRRNNFLFAPVPAKNYRMGGLSDGVMVTQRPLEALFMVRIHVGQPLLLGKMTGFQSLIRLPPVSYCLSLP